MKQTREKRAKKLIKLDWIERNDIIKEFKIYILCKCVKPINPEEGC